MELGKLGAFWFLDGLSCSEMVEFSLGLEALGYSALWYPEARGHESFSTASYLLANTSKLILASGIANIYARDPVTARQGHYSLAKFSGNRFILGLGVSHTPIVENVRKHEYGKPVPTMRAYLDAMDAAADFAPALEEEPPRVLAALGPLMTKLAGERTHGAHPYNITPAHTAQARAIVGPDKWVCAEQKILRVNDAKQARELARKFLTPYMALPNYRNNWLREGFTEEELQDGGSDRFIDAMVAWGGDDQILERVQAHWDAGANHVCVQPINPEGKALPDVAALKVLADSVL